MNRTRMSMTLQLNNNHISSDSKVVLKQISIYPFKLNAVRTSLQLVRIKTDSDFFFLFFLNLIGNTHRRVAKLNSSPPVFIIHNTNFFIL